MAITDSTSPSRTEARQRQNRWRIATVLCVVCGPAPAQDIDFSGNLRAGVSRTDNIFLEPKPDQTGEIVYQVSPELSLDYVKQRIVARVRYRFDWFRYSDLDTTKYYHTYDARLIGELVHDTLFLEIGGSRSQALKNPDIVIPSGGLPISGNLADRDEYYMEPRFEKVFGGVINTSAVYRRTEIEYDDPDFDAAESIQGNRNQTADIDIDNYRRQQGATWSLSYDWRRVDYEQSLPWEYRKATVELGFWLNDRTRLFASGGKESPWDDPIDRSLQDEFWEAGFAYKSGNKFSAEFATGERSFGSSWRGKVDFMFRRGALTFSYEEVPTTSGFDRFDRGGLFDPEQPDDVLTRPGSAERYISERGGASLRLEFRRTTVGLIIYDETRTGRFNADGTPLADEYQRGVALSALWEPGARTSLMARASVNNRGYEMSDERDLTTAMVGIHYRLGRYMGLSLTYDYSNQDPQDESTGRDYVANVTSVFVTYSF